MTILGMGINDIPDTDIEIMEGRCDDLDPKYKLLAWERHIAYTKGMKYAFSHVQGMTIHQSQIEEIESRLQRIATDINDRLAFEQKNADNWKKAMEEGAGGDYENKRKMVEDYMSDNDNKSVSVFVRY